ncbi:hypothetical protein K9M06_01420 [Candidatus Bipolaricaulota bacterium]|nr:hypothetical protein [Candidatus Bipolaricaulota bacterium]
MEVEFRVNSDHLGWDDPAIEPATQEYTNPLWPFGRREKAQEKLEEKQKELLEKNGIEEDSSLGVTVLKVDGVETEDEAWEKIRSFKEDLDSFYQEEFGLDEPLEIALRERSMA